mgnify:CR=1 FL=1
MLREILFKVRRQTDMTNHLLYVHIHGNYEHLIFRLTPPEIIGIMPLRNLSIF